MQIVQRRQFAWSVKSYFLGKIRKKNIVSLSSAEFTHSMANVKDKYGKELRCPDTEGNMVVFFITWFEFGMRTCNLHKRHLGCSKHVTWKIVCQ